MWSAILVLYLAALAAALADISRDPRLTPAMRMFWVAVALLLPVIGVVAWVIVRPSPVIRHARASRWGAEPPTESGPSSGTRQANRVN
ncbi:PLD nuclease N-terminal domain-containing protein [Salinibacterium sp. ZJ450]|uniref:PLD nuclease N-terminal domain-containing protein n=1 Tax=Salinibacterium sp. ZJ450 TaxID=2708338 RepID=UPI00174AEF68